MLALEPAIPGDEKSGKRPITTLCPAGVLSATDDPATIRWWWAAHPEANVGIAVPADWVVVDIDPRNGGEESYDALAKANGWPETLEAHTGGGGAHIIYSVPAGVRFPGKLPGRKGVDVKQVGGYIVAAPSLHYTGGVYEWASDPNVGARPAPEWLASLERGVATVDGDPGASDRELTAAECASLDELAAVLEPHFELGQRNPMAVAIGGVLRNAGLPPSAADYVMGQLPSDAPEKRLKDALGAWRAPVAAGMSRLADILPAEALGQVEAVDLRPEWQRKAGARLEQRLAERRAKEEAGKPPPPPAPAELAEDDLLDRLGIRPLGTEDPPFEYLCEGLALAKSKGKISLIAGQQGAGKGPTMNRLAIGFATGKGAFGCQCRRAKVLLLDHEGAFLTRKRIRRMCVAEGIMPSELDGWLHIADVSSLNAASDEYQALIEEMIRRYDIEVVALDSYTSALLDAGLEANQPEFAMLAKGLGQLGVCVIALAHANKASADRTGPPRLTDIAYTGALGAMAQTAIMVYVPDEADPYTVALACGRAPEERFKTIHVHWRDTDEKRGLKADVVDAPAREPTKAELKAAEAESARKAAALAIYTRLRESGDASKEALKRAVEDAGVGARVAVDALGEIAAAGIVERYSTGACDTRGDAIYRYRLTRVTPRVAEAKHKWGLVE